LPADYFFKKEFTFDNSLGEATQKNNSNKSFFGKNNNLPEDFPAITVNLSENLPPEGYYFVANFSLWGWYPDAVPFLIIMDEYGTPVFYRKITAQAYDLKKLYNGNMVYYANYGGWYRWVIEDDAYNHVDDWAVANGYVWTDWHEFLLVSEEGHEGHAFVMTYDPQFVDMSQVVPGGHPNAIVSGWIVQEQDKNKNVVFQWRSWDHYLITDADGHVDLTDSIIDPFHGNAIEVFSNTELLLSPRNLNEITKINWNTGNIIWRLGGENNMFEFVNDTLRFSRQHDCRRLENGNISLFDNGSLHPDPKYSSSIEYELDENNKTATIINRQRRTPDILGVVMGNMQWRTENSKVIGWGSGIPGISEFDANGNVVYEMEFEGISYRAYLFPWESNYFTLNKDTLQYGYIWYESALIKDLQVFNNSNNTIELTSYYSMNNSFSIENEFPISIPQNQNVQLKVKFIPDSVGEFDGILTINSDINSDTLVQRIAQQVYLVGHATSGQSVNLFNNFQTLIYPNPVTDNVTIEFSKEYFSGKIQLHNIYGEVVFEQLIDNGQKIILNISQLQKGVYLIYLFQKDYGVSENYKIIKN